MKQPFQFLIFVSLSLFTMMNLVYAAKPGLYVGAGAGRSKLETSSQNLFDNLNVKSISNSTKSGGFGSRIFIGFNFLCYFGLETGYARYADSKYHGNATTIPAGAPAKASTNYSLYAYDLVGKAYLPLGNTGLNVYVLGGAAWAANALNKEVKVDASPQQNTSPKTKKYRPIFGGGISYDFNYSGFTTFAEFTHLQGKGDVNTSTTAIPSANMATFNVSYSF